MFRQFILFLLLGTATATTIFADSVAYQGRHQHTAKRGTLVATHTHDWDYRKVDEVSSDFTNPDAILTPANDFSHTELKDGDRVLFRAPSPALTHLWISPDGQYLVGISDVMLRNPYQLVIWSRDGTRIHRQHISYQVALLTPDQQKNFALTYPNAHQLLQQRYFNFAGKTYLDFCSFGVPDKIGDKAWAHLCRLIVPHPYSPDFSASVTNHIYWFDPQKPGFHLHQKADTLHLTLRSPQGNPFTITIPSTPAPAPTSTKPKATN